MRSGGFSGLVRSHVVDVDELPRAARALVKRVFNKARLEQLAGAVPTQSGADRFSYHITCADTNNAFDVVLHEAALPDDLAEGVALLMEHALPKAPPT